MPTPQSTPEEVVAIAQAAVQAHRIVHNVDKGFWPVFQGPIETRTGATLPVWTVAFVSSATAVTIRGRVLDPIEKEYYAYINDETKEFLYIIHSTGYID
ncbi:hypothetical protein [Hymenobacter cellulosilyticus]|uniref:Uncharacterized protein n=1 Tax=Hymenobacter cellulosilyticus TaxID=2932248 RepID=A0A8T9QCX0_9BACT|nr:hypothetical protein [Hymenobacter cellulosilyticus]UOQ72683.1 hypothetical protein MUN79_01420 [Hymenobacter cellulosilyticus]